MKKIGMCFALALAAGLLSFAAYSETLPRPEYPRPQFERADWINLNGTWTYTFDFGGSGLAQGFAASEGFDGRITVPFCPESSLSGVEYKDFITCMWYQRKVDVPAAWADKIVLIHFGAVDFNCALYVDGQLAGRHWGGTVSFEFDITRFVTPGRCANLVLLVEDDVRSGVQPGGKQSARFASWGCRYTRTTGIWQTVWMEAVDPCGLKSVYVRPDLDGSRFVVEPSFYGLSRGQQLRATLSDGGAKPVAVVTVAASDAATLILPVPARRLRTWSPSDPFLYDLKFEVLAADGRVLDEVSSYAGMRKIHIEGNRMYLNNKPLFVRFVLDQGFYPDGIWTAPSDEALKADIERSMAVGFNGARLHQKVFEERFHYWADKLGYLTWGESSSWGANSNNELSARNFISEWEEIVVRDRNHPSIIAWTPFNESWDREKEVEKARCHDRMVADVYKITKALDYRPVNDVSGGYHVVTDIWTYHNYEQDAARLLEKQTLKGDGTVPTFDVERECPYNGQPYVLDEYGGIRWVIEQYSEKTWGYGKTPENMEEVYTRLAALTEVIRNLDYCSGFCYTQLTDVEQEQNGIYTYDRKTKFDAERLRAILSLKPAWAEE
jgi:beta-galactosidase/beta-glucuronidase